MRTCLLSLVCVCALAFLAPAASADWMDDIDTYALGSGLHGQGGWAGWDGNPAVNAFVSNTYSKSSPHSIAVTGPTDIVHQFSGYTAGIWAFTAWVYVPNDFAGTSYLIMLNRYVSQNWNWSTQVAFDSQLDVVRSEPELITLPLVRGQWVPIQIEINLDADTQKIYYNGALLSQKGWSSGTPPFDGGILNIGAVDLFGNGASPVYYDDLSLQSGAPVPTVRTTWGALKAGPR